MTETYKPHVLAPEPPKKSYRWWWIVGSIVVALLVALLVALFFPLSTKSKTVFVYIDKDDNVDSVFHKTEAVAQPLSLTPLRLLVTAFGYADHVRPGRYALPSTTGSLFFFRTLRNGQQEAVHLTVPVVRSMDQMAERLGASLMCSEKEWQAAFNDTVLLRKYGVTKATLPMLFVPNTYDVYWTTTPEKFLARMAKESDLFWSLEREGKAKKAGFTPAEIVTIASIVEQETAYGPEKSAVAGMYINRLHKGMKLQADPTVKFALGNFGLRRILLEHLKVNSPYNTYMYEGLPPGPIGVPSVESIDAVLDYQHHKYLFMCAKEDFSGSHNFAETYEAHQANAKRYTDALNARGIK